MSTLSSARFQNDFTSSLPADPVNENRVRQVRGAAYSFVQPTPVKAPSLVAWSNALANTLGLSTPPSTEDVKILAGNRVLPTQKPYALRYGGHQFGHWAGQLGDGRAITLGELIDRQGKSWEIQLKGAGLTPYSRRADGLAVLRSSVREFLLSEAMHHLGVPTTRALALVTTGESVVRDMFYDGRPQEEPGAIVTRVAPTFLRFGNFEILTANQELELLKQLADWCISRHYPHLEKSGGDKYEAWFREICSRTAVMIAHWLRVGFVHGVMNTDNMSILGLTIDYGPYGWLEAYDPQWTPNTTDLPGRRYAFGQQPAIGLWNLERLALALEPLIPSRETLTSCLKDYQKTFETEYFRNTAAKLGLDSLTAAADLPLLEVLEKNLRETEIDMTFFYRLLPRFVLGSASERAVIGREILAESGYKPLSESAAAEWARWFSEYENKLARNSSPQTTAAQKMLTVNPKYVLRNYIAFAAIEAAEKGDPSLVNDLLTTLERPYDEQPDKQKWFQKRPDWALNQPGCSTLSCSS